jgi:hypothetical protein
MDKEAIARIVQNALLKTPRRGNVETWVAAGEVATAILALQSSERGVERMFVLEWIAAPRPPVHPEPMRGRREFPSIEKVAEFVNNLPDDAEIDSLIEHATAKINRTAQLNAATLSPAEPSPESREGIIEVCAKVAEEYRGPPPLRHAGTCRGIASAIRALSAPAHD